MKYFLLWLPLFVMQTIVSGTLVFPEPSPPSPPSPPPLSPFERAIVNFDWSTVSNLIKRYNPTKPIRNCGYPIVYSMDMYLREENESKKTKIYKTISVLLLDDRTWLPNIPEGPPSESLGQLRALLAITRERRLFNLLRPLIDENIINDCPDDVISTIIDFTTYDTGLANVST